MGPAFAHAGCALAEPRELGRVARHGACKEREAQQAPRRLAAPRKIGSALSFEDTGMAIGLASNGGAEIDIACRYGQAGVEQPDAADGARQVGAPPLIRVFDGRRQA